MVAFVLGLGGGDGEEGMVGAGLAGGFGGGLGEGGASEGDREGGARGGRGEGLAGRLVGGGVRGGTSMTSAVAHVISRSELQPPAWSSGTLQVQAFSAAAGGSKPPHCTAHGPAAN